MDDSFPLTAGESWTRPSELSPLVWIRLDDTVPVNEEEPPTDKLPGIFTAPAGVAVRIAPVVLHPMMKFLSPTLHMLSPTPHASPVLITVVVVFL